jgi:hypothetical protein
MMGLGLAVLGASRLSKLTHKALRQQDQREACYTARCFTGKATRWPPPRWALVSNAFLGSLLVSGSKWFGESWPPERLTKALILPRSDSFNIIYLGNYSVRAILVLLFLLGEGLFAESDVTSREQFSRLLPSGLPNSLRYNVDRASLELTPDDNCPVSAHGFFELNINSQGEVTRARGVNISRSVSSQVMAVKWVIHLLLQIHFRPLILGSKTTSVHTFTTVVCQ